MTTLALILLSVIPRPGVWLVDRAERLEQNSYYDDHGSLNFTQLICWDATRCFFWRMNKCGDLKPERANGAWVLRWNDQGVYREVWARSYAESWTQHDPEVLDREYLPVEFRRKLNGCR